MQLFVANIRSNIFVQLRGCHVVKENVRKVSEEVVRTLVGRESWFC